MSSTNEKADEASTLPQIENQVSPAKPKSSKFAFWKRAASRPVSPQPNEGDSSDAEEEGIPKAPIERSSLGILNDRLTDEVPGKQISIRKFRLLIYPWTLMSFSLSIS